jgi:hypothetical protein
VSGDAHRALREQVGAYALGQLSGERWRAVHAHLEVCAGCRADLDEIAPVAGLLDAARDTLSPDGLDGEDPAVGPPPLSPELLAEVRAASGAVPGGRWPGPSSRLAAAAAVAIAVTAGGTGYLAASAGDDVPLEPVAVRALDPAVRAEAGVIPHTWGMEVRLTATGFRDGQAYVVTVTDDAGRTVGAGEFLGTGDAAMVCNLNSSIRRADAALVQVAEPDGDVVLDALV